jgi:hypothetical protein
MDHQHHLGAIRCVKRAQDRERLVHAALFGLSALGLAGSLYLLWRAQ